ncbi:MAG: adenylate/guanylate cyclase domain-containing protein [Polyangiaceae bacterium]
MAVVSVERSVQCRASVDALWPLITDTERLNRVIGLSRIELSPNDDATAARYLVKTVSGGFPLEYEERPYEWEHPRYFKVRRNVRKGLVHFLENTFTLEPVGKGSKITVRISADPKSGLISPVLRLQISRFLSRLMSFVQDADERAQSGAEAPKPEPVQLAESRYQRVSTSYLDALDGDERRAGEKILRMVGQGSDKDLDRMRPYELADGWDLPRRAVLGAALHAVAGGVLDLTWDLVCPSCRTASERMHALSELGAHAHCQLCDLTFDLDLDRAVEATFRPAAGLRAVDEGPYCIGGPARTPHVLVQAVLPPQAATAMPAPTQPGRYRLFVRGGPAAILKVAPEGGAEVPFVAGEEALEPPQAEIRPGGTVRLRNDTPRERHAKIEAVDYPNQAATAHEVSMMPEFRRQFAREVLKPGLTLRIGRACLLFTDLTGSTALYSRVGDAKAFGVVQDHFELLREVIATERGTIIKTIGDAVMASFLTEAEAIRAAVSMHRRFPDFRARSRTEHALTLKVGVHSGPCYVVTANGVLDYFGQTVNLAARLQGAAAGGELVLTRGLADQAREQGWIPEGTQATEFSAELKGLAEPIAAVRLALDSAD